MFFDYTYSEDKELVLKKSGNYIMEQRVELAGYGDGLEELRSCIIIITTLHPAISHSLDST